jgi:hypothetical protein
MTAELRRIRIDLLYRLQWNVFAALENITVSKDTNGQEIVPFLDDAAADELLADPPLSRVQVRLDDCEEKRAHDENDEEDRYRPPAPLTISNEVGTPITMRQFVTRVHAYFNENKNEIKAVKGESYGRPMYSEDGRVVGREHVYGQNFMPDDTAIFLNNVLVGGPEDAPVLDLSLFAEGERNVPTDAFWSLQLKKAETHDRLRRGIQPHGLFLQQWSLPPGLDPSTLPDLSQQ